MNADDSKSQSVVYVAVADSGNFLVGQPHDDGFAQLSSVENEDLTNLQCLADDLVRGHLYTLAEAESSKNLARINVDDSSDHSFGAEITNNPAVMAVHPWMDLLFVVSQVSIDAYSLDLTTRLDKFSIADKHSNEVKCVAVDPVKHELIWSTQNRFHRCRIGACLATYTWIQISGVGTGCALVWETEELFIRKDAGLASYDLSPSEAGWRSCTSTAFTDVAVDRNHGLVVMFAEDGRISSIPLQSSCSGTDPVTSTYHGGICEDGVNCLSSSGSPASVSKFWIALESICTADEGKCSEISSELFVCC